MSQLTNPAPTTEVYDAARTFRAPDGRTAELRFVRSGVNCRPVIHKTYAEGLPLRLEGKDAHHARDLWMWEALDLAARGYRPVETVVTK